MGKTRAYKHRLDKYYHLARQTGYRSRAAFKLIQLNQQYDFLSNATVCIDLCAAPGGWSQVASKYMPVGALIIAIDLAPIKDIPRVITMQADITAPKTHAKVRKHMQGNRADIVLNDGAPNVGAAWVTDSSNQLDLCLASLKVSTLFLKKGGTFVTKVFRSEHYNSLLWVMNQLFDKVYPTKPKASRDSSAELFVVCIGFKAPDIVDPRLLDSTYVFTDLDELTTHHSSATQIEEKLTSIDYSQCNVADFLKAPKPEEILSRINKIIFDEQPLSQAALLHPSTSPEIKALCTDIKVVGYADKKVLLKWRRKMRNSLVITTDAPAIEEAEKSDHDSDEEIESALKELKTKKRKLERAERKKRAKLRDQLLKRLHKDLNASNVDIADPRTRYGKMETPDVQDESAPKTYEQIIEENLNKAYEDSIGLKKYENDEDDSLVGPPVKFARHVEIDDDLVDEKVHNKTTDIWYNQGIFEDESLDDYEEEISESPEIPENDDSDVNEDQNLPEIDHNDVPKEPQTDLKGQSIKSFDASTYALAKKINKSKKDKKELIDDIFNRY